MNDVERVKGALERLKVFPLPNAVLLPGAAMGLHVFEPRYRELVRDALAGDRVLAVAMLAQGWEETYEGRPPLRRVGGAGVIEHHQELQDGRFNLLLRGVARVGFGLEHSPDHLYREVRSYLPAEPPATDLNEVETIRRCSFEVAHSLDPEIADPLLNALAHTDNPGALCDLVGATLIIDPEARQRVMETLDVQKRLELVVAELGVVLLKLNALGGRSSPYLM